MSDGAAPASPAAAAPEGPTAPAGGSGSGFGSGGSAAPGAGAAAGGESGVAAAGGDVRPAPDPGPAAGDGTGGADVGGGGGEDDGQAAAPGSSDPSTEPSSETSASEGGPGGAFGAARVHAVISDGARAANLWQAGSITVHNLEVSSRDREFRLRADATQHAVDEADIFVDPPGFQRLLDALAGSPLVVVTGRPRSGRRSAALQALRRSGYAHLVQLPADSDTRQLVVDVDPGEHDGSVGFLVESVDIRMIRALASFGIHELRGRVTVGSSAVVFVADAQDVAAAPRLGDVPVVDVGWPEAPIVLERRLAQACREDDVADLLAVLELLPEPLEPQRVVEVVGSVDCSPPFDPEETAASYSSTSSDAELDKWLGDGRAPDDVAMLASAATLCDLPVGDVYVQAQMLVRLLEPDDDGDEDRARRLIRRVSQQWPAEMIALTTQQVPTHFGVQTQQSISFCKGHRPDWTLRFLWDRLGPDFRNPFVEWIVGLANSEMLVDSAYYTAGVLFDVDPVTVERHIVSPWAHSDKPWFNVAAGCAIGVPAALGSDTSGARALARYWSDTTAPALVRTAIFAYGGPLGAWDQDASGPLQLARIGRDHPGLTHWADLALANLVATSEHAVRARSTVMALLENMATDYRQAERAYGVLPLISRFLCHDAPFARRSLASLMSEREAPAREVWAALLGRAFLAARGHDAAHEAVAVLAIEAANGAIDEDVVVAVLREMKRVSDNRVRLGNQLRRSLAALKHNNTRRADDATQAAKDENLRLIDLTERLMDTFFGSR